ncbi:Lipase, class 3 family-containing protein [Strongyloides ratti]|uniref:Lipase, class 3 family-containing protein n=1 Tax=Strongyloides ratti TaxID=34506 RepID=A0A090LLN2_STRRB|nr:Lipase, class 3 family-containing protein [Strongyloides ratti]CEF68465.1 Lipase, class 3 family-containing protein [Strongyloides ratti]
MAFNAYKLTAAAYANDNENLISQCLNNAYGNFKDLSHSTFNCYKNDDSCTGIYAVFPSKNLTIISFRGTKNFLSYFHQIENAYNFVQYSEVTSNYGYVEKYYKSVADDVFNKFIVKNINAAPQNMKYIITGHSLGGALAVMTALKLVVTLTAKPEDIQVITFGEPRIGDYQFAEFVQGNLPTLFRLVHNKDIIPHFPGCTTKAGDATVCLRLSQKPFHHTQEVFYNNDKDNSQYTLCDKDNGEDSKCADSLNVVDNIEGLISNYHNTYFGINIQKYGESGCQNSAYRTFSYIFYIFVIIKLLSNIL